MPALHWLPRKRPKGSREAAQGTRACRRSRLLAPPPLLAEPHLFRKMRARGRVVRGNRGIVRRQPPFFAVLLRRHIVLRAQVTLEGLEFLSVLETDDVIRRNRLLDRDRRLGRLARDFAVPARHPRQSRMHLSD